MDDGSSGRRRLHGLHGEAAFLEADVAFTLWTLLIHGARAVVSQSPRKEKLDMRGQWLKGLLDRRHSGFGKPDSAHRMGSAQRQPTVPESLCASLISAG